MQRKLLAIAMVSIGLALPVGTALALIAIMPMGPNQVANADAIFIGKVMEIEPAEVEAKAFPGAKVTVKYKVAVVKISEGIHGVKDQKSVRVGFQVPVAPKPGQPIIGGGNRNPCSS